MFQIPARARAVVIGAQAALVVALGFPGIAAAFDEGIDYKRLEQPVSTIDHPRDVQVTEIFWYGCPHCHRVREPFGAWADGLADDVRVEHMPVVFNRRVEPHARAYYAAELLGIGDETHAAIFDAIHEEGRELASPRAIADFFAEYGIEADRAEQTLDSFGVATKLRRARSVTRRAGIEGVPSFVVAGEYVTSLSQHGGTERLFEVLDYLIEKARSERTE